MKIRKFLVVLMIFASLICAEAMAEKLLDMDISRVEYELPAGMVAKVTARDGYLNVHVDTDKTDWGMVLADCMVVPGNETWFGPSIHAPEGAEKSLSMQFGDWTDSSILKHLNDPDPYVIRPARLIEYGSYWGKYDETLGYFYPQPLKHCIAVRWYPEDENTILMTEKLVYSISFTSTAQQPVSIPGYPLSLMAATELIDGEHLPNVDVYAESGALRYSTSGGSVTLVTALLCPDPEATEDSGWTCSIKNINNTEYFKLKMVEIDGRQQLAAVLEYTVYGTDSVRTKGLNVKWTRPDGTVELAATLSIIYFSGAPKTWPEYVTDWTPVSLEQMDVRVNRKISGASLDCRDGVATFSANAEEIPGGSRLEHLEYNIYITPPEGVNAKYYRSNRSESNNIYGKSTQNESMQDTLVRRDTRKKAYGTEEPCMLTMRPFKAYEMKQLDQTLYLINGQTSEFSGAITVIYWYDAQDKVVAKQYLTEKYKPFHRLENSTAVFRESDITERITLPVILVKDGSQSTDYSLNISSGTLADTNSVFYTLDLTDKWGRSCALPGECSLYLPYAEGCSMFSRMQYTVYHLDDSFRVQEIFTDSIEHTPHGLKINVSSLSPFIISWKEGEPNMQQTLILPESLKVLRAHCFEGTAASTVIVPEGCASIEENAFINCTMLKAVHLPKGEIRIDPAAFPNKEGLMLYVPAGSDAEAFAIENGFSYQHY